MAAAVGPPGLADSCVTTVPFLVFCVRGFGEPLDHAESPVPLGRELGHGPGGLVETVGFDSVENFPALFAPADQPGPFEHDQMFGDGLAGERDPSGQPASAYLAVADQEVEDLPTRRVGDSRPQLVIGLRGHPDRAFREQGGEAIQVLDPAAPGARRHSAPSPRRARRAARGRFRPREDGSARRPRGSA